MALYKFKYYYYYYYDSSNSSTIKKSMKRAIENLKQNLRWLNQTWFSAVSTNSKLLWQFFVQLCQNFSRRSVRRLSVQSSSDHWIGRISVMCFLCLQHMFSLYREHCKSLQQFAREFAVTLILSRCCLFTNHKILIHHHSQPL